MSNLRAMSAPSIMKSLYRNRPMSAPSIMKSTYRNRPMYTIRNPETGTTMTTTVEQEANSYCDSLEQQGITYIATVEIDE